MKNKFIPAEMLSIATEVDQLEAELRTHRHLLRVAEQAKRMNEANLRRIEVGQREFEIVEKLSEYSLLALKFGLVFPVGGGSEGGPNYKELTTALFEAGELKDGNKIN